MNWRSGFFRLAIAMTVIPFLIMGGIGMAVHARVKTQLTTEIENQINDDISDLVIIYTREGLAGLTQSLNARMAMTPDLRAQGYYAISSAQGELVLQAALMGSEPTAIGVSELSQGLNTLGDRLFVSTPLRGGEMLHVGRSLNPRDRTLLGIGRILGIGALISLLLGALAGVVFAKAAQIRIRAINDVCDAVSEGNLERRVITYNRGDEIDIVGNNINAMLSRVQRLLTLRKTVTDQVAHELRTPLTRLDNALVSAGLTVKDSRGISEARQGVKDCVSLLDGLLDVSALEAQSGDKKGFSQISLSDISQQMAEFYDALAAQKEIDLMLDIQRGVHMKGDAMQIQRLIANLLDNAIKYTPAGGTIAMSVMVLEGQAVLRVADSGPGINAQMRKDVFTPFFRLPGATSQSGHGLGLALCQAIAHRHDGQLSVQPPKAGGLTGANFVFSVESI